MMSRPLINNYVGTMPSTGLVKENGSHSPAGCRPGPEGYPAWPAKRGDHRLMTANQCTRGIEATNGVLEYRLAHLDYCALEEADGDGPLYPSRSTSRGCGAVSAH